MDLISKVGSLSSFSEVAVISYDERREIIQTDVPTHVMVFRRWPSKWVLTLCFVLSTQ